MKIDISPDTEDYIKRAKSYLIWKSNYIHCKPDKLDCPVTEEDEIIFDKYPSMLGEFEIGDYFTIANTKGINKNSLTAVPQVKPPYDYITRTSNNRGILQHTGKIPGRTAYEAGAFSYGLLQHDIFYRESCWYCGQYVKIIHPKEKICPNTSMFMEVVFNALKPMLSNFLVRDLDDLLLKQKILLPCTNGRPDWDYMGQYFMVAQKKALGEIKLEMDKSYERYLGSMII